MHDRLQVDPVEVLKAGDQLVRSRPEFFTREANFKAMLTTGRVWTDGLECRVVVSYPGVIRVYVAATGELLAESRPGEPLTPAVRRPAKGRAR